MRLISISIVAGIIIIGAIAKILSVKKLSERLEYTTNYRKDLDNLYNIILKTGKLDETMYHRLMEDTNKMQRELGADGIISFYHDPDVGIQVNNYPVILNFFNELRALMMNYKLAEERVYLLISSCDEALVKHIGILKDAIDIIKKRIKNPLFCFSKGVNVIISLPVKILEWCGIVSNSSSYKLLNSKIQGYIGKIVTLISLIASIMSIIMGWGNFISLVSNIIN